MTPVLQTKFGTDPEKVSDLDELGNCVQAAVAALFELELDQVPHFVTTPGDEGEWWEAMRWWARERGSDFAYVAAGPGVLRSDAIEISGERRRWPADGIVIAAGESPRGPWGHVVLVDRDGNVVHDPHPLGNGAGLVSTEGYYVVVDPYDPPPDPVVGWGR